MHCFSNTRQTNGGLRHGSNSEKLGGTEDTGRLKIDCWTARAFHVSMRVTAYGSDSPVMAHSSTTRVQPRDRAVWKSITVGPRSASYAMMGIRWSAFAPSHCLLRF